MSEKLKKSFHRLLLMVDGITKVPIAQMVSLVTYKARLYVKREVPHKPFNILIVPCTMKNIGFPFKTGLWANYVTHIHNLKIICIL